MTVDLVSLPAAVRRSRLLELGAGPADIAAAVSARELAAIGGGYYAPRRLLNGFPEERHLVLARALATDSTPGVGLANVSAAAHHGLPIPDADLSRVQLGRPGVGASGSRASGVALMHRNVEESDLVFVDGVLVTTAARTVADLARTAPRLTAIAAGDAALHRGLCTVEEIATQLGRGRHGSRRGLMLLRRMDAACESPAETRSRLLVIDAGLPVPLTQQDICDRAGTFLGRCDFLLDGDLIGECDGEGKYFGRYSDRTVEEVLEDEKYRQQRFLDAGRRFVRWSAREARDQPRRVVARIARALGW
ncbi:hypothetical protein [uncultured Williamsia sp.]|uniref:hypothetical protein n=1 Tax=uncultured Williamsia sp. TaxID=259311 RepID=UPI00261FCF4F|nr:hypothetical protein [uncultured Williamsia sp.]